MQRGTRSACDSLDVGIRSRCFPLLWARPSLLPRRFLRPLGRVLAGGSGGVLGAGAPASTLALAVLAALQVGARPAGRPGHPNHTLFAAAVAAALLLSLRCARGHRTAACRSIATSCFGVFGPSVRWSLIALYFFAAFHKLNSGLVRSIRELRRRVLRARAGGVSVSSGVSRAGDTSIQRRSASRWQSRCCSCSDRRGISACCTGMVCSLDPRHESIERFLQFLVDAVRGVRAVASGRFVAEAADLLGRQPPAMDVVDRRRNLRGLRVRRAAILRESCRRAATCRTSPGGCTAPACWPRLGALVVAAAIGGQRRPQAFVLPQPILAVVPLLVFLNGAAPHLGLQTTATWAMFSNLRTEGGRSNHFLIPATAQIFGYQRDVVQIVRSSDEYLQSAARRYIPYFEVRRRPEASIVICPAGRPIQVRSRR